MCGEDVGSKSFFTRPCQAVTGSRIDSSSDSAGTAGRTPAYASRVETASSGFTISSVYPPKAGFTGRITSPRARAELRSVAHEKGRIAAQCRRAVDQLRLRKPQAEQCVDPLHDCRRIAEPPPSPAP